MQLQQIPFFYSVNSQGLIQAANPNGQPQNIMIPTASAAGGAHGSSSVFGLLHWRLWR